VVDAIRVTRLLRSLDEGVGSLARREEAPPVERQDETWLLAVKYLFVTTIEACIDIVQHLCSAESLGTPTDNGDAIRRIGQAGVIETPTAAAIVSAVGFRHALVHESVDVDDQIVIDRLQHHEDLRDFAVQVGEWLSRQ
jgi:uncharacterized protein YutE (UPF0331/DUF86 family)